MDTADVKKLYCSLIDAWNSQDSSRFAALADTDAAFIGFDGTVMNGRAEILSQIQQIFDHHETATILRSLKKSAF